MHPSTELKKSTSFAYSDYIKMTSPGDHLCVFFAALVPAASLPHHPPRLPTAVPLTPAPWAPATPWATPAAPGAPGAPLAATSVRAAACSGKRSRRGGKRWRPETLAESLVRVSWNLHQRFDRLSSSQTKLSYHVHQSFNEKPLCNVHV